MFLRLRTSLAALLCAGVWMVCLEKPGAARAEQQDTACRAHPRAAEFPGTVPEDAPRVSEVVTVDLRVPAWHSTGLYAAPGETISVELPPELADKHLRVRIGCHKDRLREPRRRESSITVSVPLAAATTEVCNPFGGLVYIEVPRDLDLDSAQIRITGAVRAPYYVLGRTTLEQWRSRIRQRPAPWAELEGRKIVLSVPSEVVRTLDDPQSLMEFWDAVLDAQATLAAIPTRRVRPERMVADVQISAGYMHSGYPIMVHLPSARVMVDLQRLRNNGHGDVWGFFHELGHNHQRPEWTFRGTVEVTCNLFTLYCLDKLCANRNPRREVTREYRERRIRRYLEGGARFEEWQRDPFLALQMYMQMQEAFGWEAFIKVFAEYRQLPPEERPRSDDEKRDQFLVRFSRTVGRNLGPFFEAWGVPTSEDARLDAGRLSRAGRGGPVEPAGLSQLCRQASSSEPPSAGRRFGRQQIGRGRCVPVQPGACVPGSPGTRRRKKGQARRQADLELVKLLFPPTGIYGTRVSGVVWIFKALARRTGHAGHYWLGQGGAGIV